MTTSRLVAALGLLALAVPAAVPVAPGPAAAAVTGMRVWRSTANPPARGTGGLQSVASGSATDVWAVGTATHPETARTYAVIQHWNGTTWQVLPGAPVESGVDVQLAAVDVLPGGGALAVGNTRSGTRRLPRLERFPAGGGQGVELPSPATDVDGAWQGIDLLTATDGWAVGLSGAQTLIARWNGDGWQRVLSPSPGTLSSSLTAVTAVAADDAWAVGETRDAATADSAQTLVLHWDGVSWTRVPSPDPGRSNTLLGVDTAGAGDVWAVGHTDDADGSHAVALHLTGGSWQIVRSAQRTATQYSDVVAVSPTDIVLGGYAEILGTENTNIERWDGSALHPDKTYPDQTQNGLASALSGLTAEPGGGRLWAVGWATTTAQPQRQPSGLRSDH